jgi:hypothetical protein
LIDGAEMPTGDQLPGELAVLARPYAFRLGGESWDHDIEALLASLDPIHQAQRRAVTVGAGLSFVAGLMAGVGGTLVFPRLVGLVSLLELASSYLYGSSYGYRGSIGGDQL